jgi:Tfp pilus assembly PilM family ATPase/Tfp pilus assembly protein PilN
MASTLSVGIDISSKSTRVAVLERKIKFEALFMTFPTPVKLVSPKSQETCVDHEAVIKRIQEKVPALKLKKARIAMRLPPEHVHSMLVHLPVTSKNDANAPITMARPEIIPATEADHVFQSLYIGDTVIRNNPKSGFLVVRTRRTVVNKLVEVCRPLGLIPSVILPPGFASLGFVPEDQWKKQEDIAVVDIGLSTLHIVIGQNGVPAFTRGVQYGLQDIYDDLALKLDVKPDKLADVIRQHGVPKVDFDLSNKVALSEEIMRQKYEAMQASDKKDDFTVNLLELRMHWQPHLERIVQEVRRSLIYYKEQSGGRKVWRIYFSGEGAELLNMLSAIEGQLGGETRIFDAAACDKSFMSAFTAPQGLPGIGYFDVLALAFSLNGARRFRKVHLNFLPVEVRKREAVKMLDTAGFYTLITLSLIVVALVFLLIARNRNVGSVLVKTEHELKGVSEKKGALSRYAESEAQVNRRKEMMQAQTSKRNDYVRFLAKIGDAVPRDVVLKNVEFIDGKVKIQGTIKKDYEAASRILAAFRQNLEKLGFLDQLSVPPLPLERIEYSSGAEIPEDEITQEVPREFTIAAELLNYEAARENRQ